MVFNRNLPHVEYPPKIFSLDGSEIDYVECYKYLGIWLDSKLSFETHINVFLTEVKTHISFLYCNKCHWFLFIYKTHIGKTLLYLQSLLNIHNHSFINFCIPKVRTSLESSAADFKA